MATKVGEGYIEIKPKLVGFNRDMLREARQKIRELESATKEASASITVKPKIAGVTKEWQRQVQQELNAKINGLTVDVKVKLENRALKATFNDFTIEAKRTGQKAGSDLTDGFKTYIGGLQNEVRKASIAIKSGLKAADDPGVVDSVQKLGPLFKDLAEDVDGYSREQVQSINTATNSFKSLNDTVGRESTKAAREFEREFTSALKSIDRAVDRVRLNPVEHNRHIGGALLAALEDEIKSTEDFIEKTFPDLEDRIEKHGRKAGSKFAGSFTKVLKANLFDNLAEGLLSFAAQLIATGISAQPLITALANLAGGLIDLGAIAVDVYGAFLALPAVWGAVVQAGTVLTVAMFGIQEALSAVMNEDQHAAANAAVQARQIASANEQVADAKERLKRVVESSNESIKNSEQAVADAQASAAKRIASAQERIADAAASAAESVARANKRIEEAQKSLSRAYVTASERIASAESRHADSIQRVKDAQEDLNRAYSDALERFEDLNIAMGNAILDEEGAQIAIERARERLDEVMAPGSGASDLDKREAKHAYEEALQRLQELKERQDDLQREIDEANRSGVEGSKEVTDAKKRLLEAQQAEIDAQKAIAQAHIDAAEDIQQAQEQLAEAQADAVKAQLDGVERVREAEEALAEAREQGTRDVQKAQENLAKAHKDAARSIADANKDVKRAIDNLTEAQNKQNEQWFNAQYALSQLSPEAQKFVRYLADEFIPKLREVQFSIQDAFFPPIQRALEDSGGLLELFQGKLTTTAGIFGTLIGKTIEWLNTPETQNQLGRILDTNNSLFRILGEAGQNFGNVLLDVAEAAGPFLERMSKLVLDFSEWLSDITDSKDGREELKEFFHNVGETISEVWAIVKLVGGALWEVYKIARPFGKDLLDDIKGIAKRFKDWVESTEGQTQITKFLRNGRDFLREVLKLAEKVGKAFMDMGSDGTMTEVIKSIKDDLLPAILNTIDALGGGEGGGGFVFIIKFVSVALLTFAQSVTLVAAAFSLLTGDFSGARDSIADIMDTIALQSKIVFGDRLPENFDSTTKSWGDNVRSMSTLSDDYKKQLSDMGIKAEDWANATETTTDLTKTNFNDMATNVGGHMTRYRDDVDSKTKDAKDKADKNSKESKEAIVKHMEDMRRESELKMEDYRKAVDTKTHNAKEDSKRNVGDIVKDAATLLVPFSSVFGTAAQKAGEAINKPGGASWREVGAAVINGLWEGIKNLIPNLLTSVWNLGVDLLNTIRKALDINSPSKKAMKLGAGVGEGLVLGIESMGEQVGRASKKLSQSVTNGFGNPQLEVGVNGMDRKIVPSIGADGIAGVANGSRIYNTNVYAAPTVPTEKQIANVLKYQEALYDN